MERNITLTDEIGFLPHLPGEPEAINADSFAEDVLESPVPVLVEFWAARCAPCRRLSPELSIVQKHFSKKLRVFTLNVDEELPAAIQHGIWTVPTILLFVNGVETARKEGFFDATILVEWIQPILEKMNA